MNVGRASAGVLLLAIVMLAAVSRAHAITAEEFRLRSGADLVALCATPAGDPLYAAALHMCHGFGAGTYQTITALTHHEKLAPLICPPQPAPSRNEVVARFLDWASGNPGYLAAPAVETLARFFLAAYPCRPQ